MHQSIKFILFWNDTLHVSDGLSLHHQVFKTVHTATGICQTDTALCLSRHLLSSRIRRERPDPAARKLLADLYDIYHCCVYSEKLLMMDRNCPKHVEFYSKNKFEKLLRLAGFIIRIYHEAQSPERKHTHTHTHTQTHTHIYIYIYES